MAAGVGGGLHSSPWADPRPGAHVARAAAFMLHGEVENGSLCPNVDDLRLGVVLCTSAGTVPALAAGDIHA